GEGATVGIGARSLTWGVHVVSATSGGSREALIAERKGTGGETDGTLPLLRRRGRGRKPTALADRVGNPRRRYAERRACRMVRAGPRDGPRGAPRAPTGGLRRQFEGHGGGVKRRGDADRVVDGLFAQPTLRHDLLVGPHARLAVVDAADGEAVQLEVQLVRRRA